MRNIAEIIACLKKRLLSRGYVRTTAGDLAQQAKEQELAKFKPDPRYALYQAPKSYFTSEHALKLKERADWRNAPNDIREIARKVLNRLRKEYSIPMYVHTCYRSPAVQQSLVASGNSLLSRGAHQVSCAVDIVHSHFHWNHPNDHLWELLGRIYKEEADKLGVKIVWGGDWKSLYDPAHCELSNWRQHISANEYIIHEVNNAD